MANEHVKPAPALTGAERAAVVLRELGVDVAVAVMRHMDESTIARVSAAMSRLQALPATVLDGVMVNFATDLGVGIDGGGSMQFIKDVLVAALGEMQARTILAGLTRSDRNSPFLLPVNADSRTLATQMASERPQTIALLLAHVPHDTGAAMLSFLPEQLAAEALYRFALLDAVSPGAVVELREMLAELMTDNDGGGKRLADLGGPRQTADILNRLQTGLSDKVLTAIEAMDTDTAEKIRQKLFTFLDLGRLTDRALQILLREVPNDRLAPALRLVDDVVRTKFFQNMSSRMVEVLKEELTSGPPMRRADALAAQNDIVSMALKLAAEGRISINATEEMV